MLATANTIQTITPGTKGIVVRRTRYTLEEMVSLAVMNKEMEYRRLYLRAICPSYQEYQQRFTTIHGWTPPLANLNFVFAQMREHPMYGYIEVERGHEFILQRLSLQPALAQLSTEREVAFPGGSSDPSLSG